LLDNVEVHLPVPDSLEFALLNPGGHGYYRVHYDPDLRRQLLARLPDGLLPIDRFNLINDAWATCLAGVMPLREYLDMTAHFEHDRSPRVWSVVLSSLDRMEHLISRRHRPALESFVRARLGPTMTGLGWSPRPGEDDLTRELRGDIIGTMGTLGNDAEVQARARTLYASVLHTPESVDPNLVPPLIEIMAFTGDEARYDEFFSRFKEARTPQEERRYLFSLGAFRDPSLVARTLASTLNGDIRVQDGAAVIGSLLSTSHGRDQAWAFVKANWKTFEQRFPANGLRRLLAHLPGLATPALERDVHRFIDRHKIDLGGKALAQSVEQLRVAVAFRERESVALRAYVSSFKRSG
jgi:puromycin-sensitive aminopeptidase